MHHPMFALSYLDYQSIIVDFLPRMKEHNYDVFFAGHEHLMNYANIPTNKDPLSFTTDYMTQKAKEEPHDKCRYEA